MNAVEAGSPMPRQVQFARGLRTRWEPVLKRPVCAPNGIRKAFSGEWDYLRSFSNEARRATSSVHAGPHPFPSRLI